MEESKNNTTVLQDLKGIIGDDYDWSIQIDKNDLYLSISINILFEYEDELTFNFNSLDQCGYLNVKQKLCYYDIKIAHDILLYMEKNAVKICELINLFSKKESVV